ELPRELAPPAAAVSPRELVDHHPADVVAVTDVFPARVSEADDEQVERRGAVGAPPEEAHWLALAGLGLGALSALGRLGGFGCLRDRRFLRALLDLFGLFLDLGARRRDRREHRLLGVVEERDLRRRRQVGEPERIADS